MSQPNAGNTLSLSIEPFVPGYPAIVDDSFQAAVASSEDGGPGTQKYFDSQNQTADFWNLVATNTVTFAPGTDAAGRAVAMASSGNVDLRIQAVWAESSQSKRIGILTLTTREVEGSGVSRMLMADVVINDNPSSRQLDETAFQELLPALYESTETMLVALASSLAEACRVESPAVDTETLTAKALFSASQKAISTGVSLVEYGIGWAAVAWGAITAEALGLGALMAIPAIVEFLGHQMMHSMQVQNLTGSPFAWQVTIIHGVTTVNLPAAEIPAMAAGANPLDPASQVVLASEVHQLYSNYSQWSSIGYVLKLMPRDGSAESQVVVSIPWAGDNVIWAGESSSPAHETWDSHKSNPSPPLSLAADIGDKYAVAVSLNRLGGKEGGSYFYCSSIVIQPCKEQR